MKKMKYLQSLNRGVIGVVEDGGALVLATTPSIAFPTINRARQDILTQ
jgi:hypothetical protein